MATRVARPGVRDGYDRWAESYDRTPNPLVALDRRHTIECLAPRPGERILDAACGTGAHLGAMLRAGSRPAGLDLSRGMLGVTRRKHPTVPLVQADLDAALPARDAVFDAVLCALVGEHLVRPERLFAEAFRGLVPGGRLVFSVFHPEMAAGGIEANFRDGDTEYRLGALDHAVADYLDLADAAGFAGIASREYRGDAALVEEIPSAAKYLDRPLLLVLEAEKPT